MANTGTRVAVVALGKIGLPLAVQFAGRGCQVIGADVNPAVVDLVVRGEEPFPGEAELAERLREVVGNGSLSATTDTTAAVEASDVVVVVVPLFVDASAVPDFTWMDAAVRQIAVGLHAGSLVIFETTLPVGTTRGRWKPLLEELSGLREGVDFHVVFSPERVLTGRVFADLRRYPKLIGALNSEGASRAAEFYEAALEFDPRPDLARPNGVWDLGSAEAAELAKLAETTYRDVNIGLANQFARFADTRSIDIYQVIEASNSQPYSHIHRPGIAVGGHCIPVYPRLYLWTDPDASIVTAARAANAEMPEHAVALLQSAHGALAGQRVVVLGAAYRGGVKETAFSGVFSVVRALDQRGAVVFVDDPMFSDEELTALGFQPHVPGSPVDCAVVQADHEVYRQLSAGNFPGLRTVLDGRRWLDSRRFPGVHVVTLGAGGSGAVVADAAPA